MADFRLISVIQSEDSIQATCNNLICCETDLNVFGNTRNMRFKTRFAAMLQNKLDAFVARFTVTYTPCVLSSRSLITVSSVFSFISPSKRQGMNKTRPVSYHHRSNNTLKLREMKKYVNRPFAIRGHVTSFL